eukprot:1160836-Pelagomonas_calceolata.AAC.1
MLKHAGVPEGAHNTHTQTHTHTRTRTHTHTHTHTRHPAAGYLQAAVRAAACVHVLGCPRVPLPGSEPELDTPAPRGPVPAAQPEVPDPHKNSLTSGMACMLRQGAPRHDALLGPSERLVALAHRTSPPGRATAIACGLKPCGQPLSYDPPPWPHQGQTLWHTFTNPCSIPSHSGGPSSDIDPLQMSRPGGLISDAFGVSVPGHGVLSACALSKMHLPPSAPVCCRREGLGASVISCAGLES